MAIHYELRGEIAQTAHLRLDRDDHLWASRGSLMVYSRAVEWTLRIPGGAAGALRRSLAGEGLALTSIRAGEDAQRVVLGANAPGHVAVWDLADGPVLTTRGAFLAAWGDVDIDVAVARRAGAAFFGGVGLFLQRVSGAGLVLVHGAGDFVEERLGKGESVLVSTGNLAALGESVDYDIERVGGVRKTLFGSEGFFMTRLTGPGTVLLQTLKRGLTQGRGR